MMKNILMKAIGGISYLFLFMGVGLLASALFFANKAETGGGIPAQNELKTISGQALEGREVTLETKRRRGVDSKDVFYEIDLKDNSGKIIKLRLDKNIPKPQVEAMLEGSLTVQYDASDNNLTYDVQKDNKPLIVYADLAKMAQEKANKQAAFFSSSDMYISSAWWIGIGIAGLVLRRRFSGSNKKSVETSAT